MSEMIERLGPVVQAWAEGHGAFVSKASADELVAELLRVMREPTDAMMEAGDPEADPDYHYDDHQPTLHAWRAMIDAALTR